MKLFSSIILCLFMNGCGFQCMNPKLYNKLSSVYVQPIQSLEGIAFYNHLKTLLPYGDQSKYHLISSLSFTQSPSFILNNSDITRETINVQVTYQIQSDKNIIHASKFKRHLSFHVKDSAYNSLIKQEEIKYKLAIIAAEEMRNRIISFMQQDHENDSN